jgi:hypothetical protein
MVREKTMTRRRFLLGCTLGCVLFLAIPAAPAQTLQIVGTDGHSTTVSAAQITDLPHVTISVVDHDKPATFDGVAMARLLSLAGVQLGDALRGPRLTEVVLVEAADGYRVAFALAEMDSAFATREIILADKRDGKPLAATEGPFRIVAPGDKRPARWIRQVTTFRITVAK